MDVESLTETLLGPEKDRAEKCSVQTEAKLKEIDTTDAEVCPTTATPKSSVDTSTGHLEQLVIREEANTREQEPTKEETASAGEKRRDEEEKSDDDDDDEPDKVKFWPIIT